MIVATPHGRCAIVELVDDAAVAAALAALPDAEQQLAARRSPVRRRELVAGRSALHAALAELDPRVAHDAIGVDDRGAPRMPAGWHGSVSHKAARAAGLVAPAEPGMAIGVDLERARPPRADIGRRVLTGRERDALAGLAPDAYGRAVTLRFAIKEAIYKAVDPSVRRYVAFTEVELEVREDGACAVQVVDVATLPMTIEAAWRELDGHWLATARAVPR